MTTVIDYPNYFDMQRLASTQVFALRNMLRSWTNQVLVAKGICIKESSSMILLYVTLALILYMYIFQKKKDIVSMF